MVINRVSDRALLTDYCSAKAASPLKIKSLYPHQFA